MSDSPIPKSAALWCDVCQAQYDYRVAKRSCPKCGNPPRFSLRDANGNSLPDQRIPGDLHLPLANKPNPVSSNTANRPANKPKPVSTDSLPTEPGDEALLDTVTASEKRKLYMRDLMRRKRAGKS